VLIRKTALGLALAALLTVSAVGKDKQGPIPDDILDCKNVVVLVLPVRGDLPNCFEDRTVIANVQSALKKWGRWRVVSNVREADFVIAVRSGSAATISFGNMDGKAKVGLERDNGPSGDQIAVYRLNVDDDDWQWQKPVWKFIFPNSLNPKNLLAVAELRKLH
jgi:hypothetical protein